MGLMAGVNRLPVEHFVCWFCEEDRTDAKVRSTWKCPKCQNHVHIHAEDPETGTKITLIRKRGDEVEAGDLVHLPGQLAKDCHEVLGVSKVKGKIGIGLKGYGQYRVQPGEAVNCRIGGSWV